MLNKFMEVNYNSSAWLSFSVVVFSFVSWMQFALECARNQLETETNVSDSGKPGPGLAWFMCENSSTNIHQLCLSISSYTNYAAKRKREEEKAFSDGFRGVRGGNPLRTFFSLWLMMNRADEVCEARTLRRFKRLPHSASDHRLDSIRISIFNLRRRFFSILHLRVRSLSEWESSVARGGSRKAS